MINRWREETPGDRAFIDRVLAHFNQQEFYYTLNPPLLSQHTVDEFMFDTRSGFCEHYASAFTVMMRMAGIPARIVTGYQGGWYNSIGNYVLVRQSDAHAWSEVWLADSGWTRVDPTAAVAPSRVERGSFDAFSGRRHMFDYQWLRSVKNGFDILQQNWNEWVIAFDSGRQSSLFKSFGMDYMDPKRLVAVMIFLIGLIALLMLPAILKLRINTGLDAAGKQWLRFRKKLDGAGISSSAAMTPAELTLVASQQLEDQEDQLEKISSLYRNIRYSPERPNVRELEFAVKQFKARKKIDRVA
jgi:hypothetical protein